MESTVDLAELGDHALSILTDSRMFEAFRYLAGPPISLDDLKVLADAKTISPSRLTADPVLVKRLVDIVLLGLDRRRFPWVTESREPTESEKSAAIVASAALVAAQRVATDRRSEGKTEQERRVEEMLLTERFEKVPTRPVNTLADAPALGQFCRECVLVTRKADLLVGLWDGRLMPIECKVSNSSTNSIKRLNNDAAIKAEFWRKDLGEVNVVPTAVLSGVYALKHLVEVQRRGLTVFWAHDLSKLAAWIESTRPSGSR